MNQTKRMGLSNMLRTLQHGPSFNTIHGEPFTPEEASRQVRLWLDSWVVPVVEEILEDVEKQAQARRKKK